MNGVKIMLNHFSLEGASCKTMLQAILSKYKMFLKLCMILALAWSRNPPSPPSEGQLGHLCLNCHCLRKPTLKRSLPVSPFSQLIPPCFIVTCEKRQWLLVSFSFEHEKPLVWSRGHLWLLAFTQATHLLKRPSLCKRLGARISHFHTQWAVHSSLQGL